MKTNDLGNYITIKKSRKVIGRDQENILTYLHIHLFTHMSLYIYAPKATDPVDNHNPAPSAKQQDHVYKNYPP